MRSLVKMFGKGGERGKSPGVNESIDGSMLKLKLGVMQRGRERGGEVGGGGIERRGQEDG